MRTGQLKTVTQMCDVSPSTVWLWARTTDFPKPFKLVGVTVWDLEEVTNWLATQKEKSRGSNGETQGRAD